MTGWAARRFWKAAASAPAPGGHALMLDGRPVRTPARAPLVLPSRALADAVAAEWNAQQDRVRPETMPMTRLANAAIDRVIPAREEIAAAVAAYGASDLLCYRATRPQALADRQAAAWDPVLAWARRRHGARLRVQAGVIFAPQPPESLARLTAAVEALAPFPLAALHELVALSGSLLLGLAVHERHLDPATAWTLSRIDEDWQAEHWGRDAEAEAAAAAKRADFLLAARFLELVETPDD
ncbi:MAG: ATPase [Alphaproteobacteria bacterium]|nr:MAG: ATPase [Alphaproteobacteria bacterium]